jgi:type II secretory pathway component PulC
VSAPATPDASPPSYVPPPQSSYDEIAERPLFVPERRPQQDEPPQTAASAPPVVVVEGVVLSAEHRYAIIAYGKPAKRESIPEGGTIDGWRVEHIGRDSIALSAGSRAIELPVGKTDPTPPSAADGHSAPNELRTKPQAH